MSSLRTLFAKLRYPMPEVGDFSDRMPLDKYLEDDGDDNNVKLPNPVPPEPKPKPKGKK